MFTGIIQKIGTVVSVKENKRTKSFEFKVAPWKDQLEIGESIAVDGVCLTAKKKTKSSFFADAIHATLRVTTLGHLKVGSKVNLERSLKWGDRLGGHLVSGHVDAVSKIDSIKKQGRSNVYSIQVPKSLQQYLIPKGSIAIDGISLTIQKETKNGFQTAIIPHTGQKTTIRLKKAGDRVNLEADQMAKRFFKRKSK